ncbi:glycosyl hydrolase family 18 protein [Ureibacillus acetophenoni]|uniref:Spore germination protein n=1 Tax=Ureibacillus acetophenoni TaxID=614649 RepID=A0A285UJZ6_9BACL|nr:glycosyl hydrolase family 18 protein [Ureibacillus acetophenoni]SOC40926.1 spore germination protein [Ureibacillus acetophenoni]
MYKKCLAMMVICFTFLLTLSTISNAQVIHEVKAGDRLSEIAKQYGITVNDLAKLNGLDENAHLVLGQAILIPGSTYIVQPKDSIWEIANRHVTNEETLMSHNQLTSRVIHPGQKLEIPSPQKANVWAGTYFVPKDKNTNAWMLDHYQDTLSSIFVFEYRPDPYGNLILLEENEAHTLAWKKNIPPYATLTNLSEVGFDADLTHQIMSNPSIRKKLIENIYSLLDSHDYKGIVVDFELVPIEDRENLNQFIKELTERLHPKGMEVMIAVPPKQGDYVPDYSSAYDYKTLGQYVDRMFLMTYNWHWPGGPSGPISPIDKVRRTLDYAVSVVPSSKLMLGIPQYAYDWTITEDERIGTAYSTQHAIDLYTRYQSEIYYDEVASTPWFRYVDEEGILHEVWFEDPRSLLAKIRLVHEYGLGGIGCWHLGITMPQTEDLILEEFNVIK